MTGILAAVATKICKVTIPGLVSTTLPVLFVSVRLRFEFLIKRLEFPQIRDLSQNPTDQDESILARVSGNRSSL